MSNLDLQQVSDSINLGATPDKVWELIGQFGGYRHPLIANIKLIDTGIGQLRVIETIDRKQIIERLEAIDNSAGCRHLSAQSCLFSGFRDQRVIACSANLDGGTPTKRVKAVLKALADPYPMRSAISCSPTSL